MKKKLLVLIVLILFILPIHIQTGESLVNASSPTFRYVSESIGTDAGDCTDPNAPCKSIQYAVIKSISGDSILVSEGIYKYQAINFCNIAIVCYINIPLTIKGGYPLQSWSNPDPENHPSIIDGEYKYRGVAVRGETGKTNTHLEMTGFSAWICAK